MKKHVLKLTLFFLAISGGSFAQCSRFLSEVFPSVDVATNVTYGQNYTLYFVPTPPTLIPLRMDVYTPAGLTDTMTRRPLVLYLHTGSFLPLPYSGATGTRTDSSVVEMCKQFARRGYVSAAVDYRLGWNLTSADQDERTGTLLQAVYRGIQDVKACVRFFKANADTGGNDYAIDTNNIIICGQGTGGYLALAYVTMDKTPEISLAKFLSSTTNMTAPYFFQAGLSYINTAVWGDFEGNGGNPALNFSGNAPGYSSAVSFSVNLGGSLADSSWLEAGDVPMVSFHLPLDPFAPYAHGPVYVPLPPPASPLYVVDVDGSEVAQRRANILGNNSCMSSAPSTPYTQRANSINNGDVGFFPIITDSSILAAPWEWWDSTTIVNYAIAAGFTPTAAVNVHLGSLSTNNTMSKAQALTYIDTIQNYANTMLVNCLNLDTAACPVGINEHSLYARALNIYPNPADDVLQVDASAVKEKITAIEVYDLTGRKIYAVEPRGSLKVSLGIQNIPAGMYFVRVLFDKGEAVKKITVQ